MNSINMKEGSILDMSLSMRSTLDLLTIHKKNLVFVDSIEALNYLYKIGLSKDAKVITNSPFLYLHFKDHINVEYFEGRLTSHDRFNLLKFIGKLSKKIYDDISEDLLSHTQKIQIQRSISNIGILKLINCFKENEISGEVLIAKTTMQSEMANEKLNPPWEIFFPDSCNVDIYHYDMNQKFSNHSQYERGFNFLERLKYLNGDRLKNKLLLKFYKALRRVKPSFSKNIIFSVDNPLLFELGPWFMWRGFAGVRVSNELRDATKAESKAISNDIKLALQKIFSEISPSFFEKFQLPFVERIIFQVIERSLSEFDHVRARTISELDSLSIEYNSSEQQPLFFTNYPMPAVYQGCKDMNVKLVTFQHGHCREILDRRIIDEHPYSKEDCVSDVFLTYDDGAKTISSESPYCISKIYSVGLPYVYKKKFSLGLKRRYDFIYVSTLNICPWFGPIFQDLKSNLDAILFEESLIENVLAKSSSQILYKPYLSSGFFHDEGYIRNLVHKNNNMTYYADRLNLKYLFTMGKVFITSRATSTLGWCLMADVPLVFIDIHDDFPLDPTVAHEIKKSIFYFNSSEDDFQEKLLTFLQQDISLIKKQWDLMAQVRQEFIDDYFGKLLSSKSKKLVSKSIIGHKILGALVNENE
jgi:hypothetical protein